MDQPRLCACGHVTACGLHEWRGGADVVGGVEAELTCRLAVASILNLSASMPSLEVRAGQETGDRCPQRSLGR